jgi:beta-glucuronidase
MKGRVTLLIVDDPLGEHLDLLAVNEYEGWYGSRSIDDITNLSWETPYDKPMIFSEFGAGALFGIHGPKHERWTEEYQQYFYQQTLKMSESIPFLRGASPWILKDFRSPRRFHGLYQNFWNRKGPVSETGEKTRVLRASGLVRAEKGRAHGRYPWHSRYHSGAVKCTNRRRAYS